MIHVISYIVHLRLEFESSYQYTKCHVLFFLSGLCSGVTLKLTKSKLTITNKRLPLSWGPSDLTNYIRAQFPRVVQFKYYLGKNFGNTLDSSIRQDLAPNMFKRLVGKGKLYIGPDVVKPLVCITNYYICHNDNINLITAIKDIWVHTHLK